MKPGTSLAGAPGHPDDGLSAPPLWASRVANHRVELLCPLLAAVAAGVTKYSALRAWSIHTGLSAATGRRWLDALLRGGVVALAPRWGQRQRNKGTD